MIWFHEFGQSFDYVVFSTPHGVKLISDADFIEADVTFPGCASFPYTLNLVTYNADSNHFETVARSVLNKLRQYAYKTVFGKIFEIVTNFHPSFNHGQSVTAWILDFSIPQHDGLAAVLGTSSGIRGRRIHFCRNARKVAVKVLRDDKTSLAFHILKGDYPFFRRRSSAFTSRRHRT